MSEYNTPPEGLEELHLDDWQRLFFMYCLEPVESRQVRDTENNKYYDLRMFDILNFDNKKLGVAIMYDWFDPDLDKNRPKAIIRFCRYGLKTDWDSFQDRFAAQFAGDNS